MKGMLVILLLFIESKKEKRKKTFNEHYKAPKYFYSVHKFSCTISDESASKETLKWLNSVLHKRK